MLPCSGSRPPRRSIRLVQRKPPVDADDVGAEAGQQVEHLGHAEAEVDARDVEAAERVERAARVRRHATLVVVARERARPRVEELHDARAGLDLRPDEGAGDVGAPVEQRRPGVRVGAHERAGAELLLRRAALDEVARERVGRAAEADERRGAELGHDDAHGLRDRGERLGLERGAASGRRMPSGSAHRAPGPGRRRSALRRPRAAPARRCR